MKFKMTEIDKMQDKSRAEKLNHWKDWYIRGAIGLEELIYHVANVDKLTKTGQQLEFEELADMLLNVLEDNTKAEKADTRKELLKILIERGI